MGVLSNITDEYFGDKKREEDVVFRYNIDEKCPPKNELEPETVVFLRGLAEHRLFLDKSLSFQINDLQRHTRLILSGRWIDRYEFPPNDEQEKEIEELDNLIKSIEERLGQSHREDQKLEELLNVCKRQQKELEKALGSTDARPYLGMYYYDDDECVITLFVDVIESITIGLDEMMLLMGEVLLHEYFHSFYHHVGVGAKDILRCMEEPMAEYGSLVVLDSVASSNSRIASMAKEALEYSKDFIEKKQSCIGRIAAYGFGAYLYEFHKDDYQSLIANYANVSLLLDKQSNIALEYKYMLYPEYPAPWNEDVAYKKLKALLNVDGVRPSRKDTNMAKRTFQIEHAVTTTSFYSVEAVSREEAESLFMLGKVKKEWEDKNENLDISKMEED
ncbi:MAG: hypothetical protein MSS40_02380 [Bacteroidales bacterium]|nr:hypothetical protein [Bacteroidales bacterium]